MKGKWYLMLILCSKHNPIPSSPDRVLPRSPPVMSLMARGAATPGLWFGCPHFLAEAEELNWTSNCGFSKQGTP